MKAIKRKFEIDTHDYGVFYRWATSAGVAKFRVVYAIYGRGYEGWAHDYWTVRDITDNIRQEVK